MGGEDAPAKDSAKERGKKQLVPGWPHPEMDAVTPEQELIIQDLLNVMIKAPPADAPPVPQHLRDASEEDQRILSYKFLVARKWKLEDALKMWRESNAFKEQHKVYEKPYFPPAFAVRGYDYAKVNAELGLPPRDPNEFDRTYRQIAPYYQATYHKHDKLNHPVFYERTGRIGVKGLVKAFKGLAGIGQPPSDVCVNYHVHFNEVGARLVSYNDRTLGAAAGRRVLSVVCILDCDGLGYHTLYNPALELLKKIWAVDAAFYPEGLHRVYIVNCPAMINFAYSIVKGWLDPRVRGKLQFVRPDKTAEVLLEVIDAENLPERYGGKCCCEGGCIETPDVCDEGLGSPDGADGMLTEEIRVSSGKNETREYQLDVGEEVAWEWEVTDKNVEFGVTFYPVEGKPTAVTEEGSPGKSPGLSPATPASPPQDAKDKAPQDEVVKKEKGNTGGGSFTAPTAGRLVLVWDNHYSWLTSKILRLRVFKVPAKTSLDEEKPGPCAAVAGGTSPPPPLTSPI